VFASGLASSSGNSWAFFVKVRRGPLYKGSPEFKSCLRRRLEKKIIITIKTLLHIKIDYTFLSKENIL